MPMKLNSSTGGLYCDPLPLIYDLTILCSCAQVKVTGSGKNSPGTTYQIPGLYTDNMKLFNGVNLWTNSADEIESAISQTPIGDDV